MSDSFGDSGLEGVPQRAAEAAAAMENLREPAERAASAIEDAFGRAGESLTRRCPWPNWRGPCWLQ